MPFRGKYEFLKITWIEDDKVVLLQKLSPKEAADPSVLSGAMIKLANEIDQLLVVGDEVWKIGPARGEWRLVDKLPQKEADLLMDWLRVEEK